MKNLTKREINGQCKHLLKQCLHCIAKENENKSSRVNVEELRGIFYILLYCVPFQQFLKAVSQNFMRLYSLIFISQNKHFAVYIDCLL